MRQKESKRPWLRYQHPWSITLFLKERNCSWLFMVVKMNDFGLFHQKIFEPSESEKKNARKTKHCWKGRHVLASGINEWKHIFKWILLNIKWTNYKNNASAQQVVQCFQCLLLYTACYCHSDKQCKTLCTWVSDFEAPLVGCMVSGPSQIQLICLWSEVQLGWVVTAESDE